MSKIKSENFEFKNVSHIKRINFSPEGDLISKKRVAHNIDRYSNYTDDEKTKEIDRQKSIPNLNHGFTTIMCYAAWCGHCQHAKPVYDNICKASKCMNVQLCAIDCANDTEGCVEALNKVLDKKFKHDDDNDKLVRGYPTFLQFKDGKFLRRFDKSPDGENLLQFVLGL